jgi:hypothetical protein
LRLGPQPWRLSSVAMTMQKRLLPFAALLLCALFAAPAQANFKVAMADQNARMFDSAKFRALDIERVRYLVPYDWEKHSFERAAVSDFMNAAKADGTEVLVHFTARRGCYRSGHYSSSKKCRAPSVSKYTKMFKRFRAKFPESKTFGVWNEGNHVSQPLFNKPRLAAKYFLAARKACRSCTLVAADVLDGKNMTAWVTQFKRYAKNKATIWGLHNYGDVNRRRTSGTRQLLRIVPGQVWATETGGILKFQGYPRSERRQAKRTKYMFRLFAKYDSRGSGMRSRLTRLYNYQWTGAKRSARFDAGLVNLNGTPRKAYRTFKRYAAKYDR